VSSGRPTALVRSCHPAPTVAVTVLTTVLVGVAGNSAATCVIAAVALLSGQLSIGWSNDLIDAARDARANRSDKPVSTGALSRQLLVRAIASVLVLTIVASLALGWRAGVAHLLGVACGWLYNLGLKSTVASPLPYLVAFGALPAVATLATPRHPLPPAWSVAAAALIGVAAHLANVLPDIADDLTEGVRGLPHRLGGRRSALLAAATICAATLVVLFGPARRPSAFDWGAVAAVVALTALGVRANAADSRSATAFYTIMAAAAVDLLLIAVSHSLPG
jgi:4-hydroxybenzoate polyprenyltransferase